MTCEPYVNKETLEVTFSLPNFDTSPEKPPVAKPSTGSFFSEAELINNQEWLYYVPNRPDMEVVDPDVSGSNSDEFFMAVWRGPVPSTFFGPKKIATKKLQDRIDEVCSIIVAQIYGGKRRFPTMAQDANLRYNGTVQAPPVSRVMQDRDSTWIIQVILAVTVICAVISMVMVQSRKLLPANPCTILGVASFLAHSSILSEETIPLGSEFYDDDELRKMGIL